MSTNYSDVYDFFLSKVSEYSFINLNQSDLELQLLKYLRSSVVSFSKSKVDLRNRDDIAQVFNIDLNDDEKEVLSTFMIYHFMTAKVFDSSNYKQMMSDGDFKIYSQANHLKALSELRKGMKKEAGKLMTEYGYKDRDLSTIPNTNKDSIAIFTADGIWSNPWYFYNGNN